MSKYYKYYRIYGIYENDALLYIGYTTEKLNCCLSHIIRSPAKDRPIVQYLNSIPRNTITIRRMGHAQSKPKLKEIERKLIDELKPRFSKIMYIVS